MLCDGGKDGIIEEITITKIETIPKKYQRPILTKISITTKTAPIVNNPKTNPNNHPIITIKTQTNNVPTHPKTTTSITAPLNPTPKPQGKINPLIT